MPKSDFSDILRLAQVGEAEDLNEEISKAIFRHEREKRAVLLTALCWACRYGHLDVAKSLIVRWGVDPNSTQQEVDEDEGAGKKGSYLSSIRMAATACFSPPLIIACECGHLKLARYLIETANADPNVGHELEKGEKLRDGVAENEDAPQESCTNGKQCCIPTKCPHNMAPSLRGAIRSGRHHLVRLLLTHGARMRGRAKANTITAYSSIGREEEGQSLPQPAPPEMKESCDVRKCPIACAFFCSTAQTVRILLEYGAHPCVDAQHLRLPLQQASAAASSSQAQGAEFRDSQQEYASAFARALSFLFDSGADLDSAVVVAGARGMPSRSSSSSAPASSRVVTLCSTAKEAFWDRDEDGHRTVRPSRDNAVLTLIRAEGGDV